MILIKLITLILAFVSIVKSYLDYRRKRESFIMFIFWAVIWIAAAAVIIYPLLIAKVTAFATNQSLTLGSLVGMTFIFMLYIIYRIYTKAARIEYQQAELVRQLGLKNMKKK